MQILLLQEDDHSHYCQGVKSEHTLFSFFFNSCAFSAEPPDLTVLHWHFSIKPSPPQLTSELLVLYFIHLFWHRFLLLCDFSFIITACILLIWGDFFSSELLQLLSQQTLFISTLIKFILPSNKYGTAADWEHIEICHAWPSFRPSSRFITTCFNAGVVMHLRKFSLFSMFTVQLCRITLLQSECDDKRTNQKCGFLN